MIAVRPIWMPLPQPAGMTGTVVQLFGLESRACSIIDELAIAARRVYPEPQVAAVVPLLGQAKVEFVAACELARCGYLKQSYSLARSWFEQTLFAIYFIESTIERIAWQTSEVITLGTEPRHKLMLHQLFEKGSRQHPFRIAYLERFKALLAGLKIDGSPKTLFERAEERLTDLSQGVHGTFQPSAPKAAAEVDPALTAHVIPVLQRAVRLVGLFAFVCVQTQLDLSEQQLARMRVPGFVPTPEAEEEEIIAALTWVLVELPMLLKKDG